MTNNEGKFLKDELMPVFQARFRDALSEMNTRLQWRIQDFSKGGDFCKRGVTIHCPITKICDLGAFFLYFSFVLAQNRGGVTSHPFHPPGSSPGLVLSFAIGHKQYQDIVRNHLGKKLCEVTGLNLFYPKDTVVQELNKAKELLSREVGLVFTKWEHCSCLHRCGQAYSILTAATRGARCT